MKAIVVVVDNKYADYARLTIHDAWAYSGKQYPVYVFHDDSLNVANGSRIEKLRDKYGIDIRWWRIDRSASFYKDLPGDSHISSVAYAKLFMGDLLWEGIRTAYYIDIDTLILRDLSEFFAIEPKKSICVVDHNHEEDHVRLYGEPGRYINTGVIIANLPRWKSINLGKMIEETIETYGSRLRWVEQDIMMNVFKDDWEELPIEYNFMMNTRFNSLLKASKTSDWDSEVVNPAILHFTGPVKPWMDGSSGYSHRKWRKRINLI